MIPPLTFISLLIPLSVLFFEVPIWAGVSCLAFIILKLSSIFLKWKSIPKIATAALSVLFLLFTLFQFRTLIGREAAGTFLFILTGLRILEYDEKEDNSFLIILGIFLICTALLFNFNILISLTLALDLLYLTYILISPKIRLHYNREMREYFLKLVFISLPLAAIFFITFPRVSELIWNMSTTSSSVGTTGFSGELKPGSIDQLVQSDKIILRAELSSNLSKELSDMYWRGETLTHSDGLSWSSSNRENSGAIQNIVGSNYDYKVLFDGSGDRWIFTLPQTQVVFTEQTKNRNDILKTKGGVFKSKFRLKSQILYYGRISVEPPGQDRPKKEAFFSLVNESPLQLKPYLQLPPWINSEWKKKLQNQVNINPFEKSPKVVNEQLLNFFKINNFKYSLQPGKTTFDEFLFSKRVGFCEHFAAALGILLRIYDVPSRIVLGFQGGEYNSNGKYWTVKEKDAHAWVEYFDGKNWILSDATMVVAPLRVELGAQSYYDLPKDLQNSNNLSLELLAKLKQNRQSLGVWTKIQHFFENLNYRWSEFLLNFDLEKQKEILNALIEKFNSSHLMLALILIFILIPVIVISFKEMRQYFKKNLQDSEYYYDQFIKEFEVYTLPHFKSLGPKEIELQVVSRFSFCSMEIQGFLSEYIKIVYSKEVSNTKFLSESWKKLLIRKSQMKL